MVAYFYGWWLIPTDGFLFLRMDSYFYEWRLISTVLISTNLISTDGGLFLRIIFLRMLIPRIEIDLTRVPSLKWNSVPYVNAIRINASIKYSKLGGHKPDARVRPVLPHGPANAWKLTTARSDGFAFLLPPSSEL